MSDKRRFNFKVSLLVQEGGLILNAAENGLYSVKINGRLSANYVSETRALVEVILGKSAQRKSDSGDLGELTLDQKNKLAVMREKMSAARETAKLAFPGHSVKLHEEFQIGSHKDNDLESVLARARIILASLQKTENIPAITGKGWQVSDTQALSDAIDALAQTEDSQEAKKPAGPGTTGDLTRIGNDFYERLLTIQHAAHLEWPESNSANLPIRALFRIGQFPPKTSNGPTADPATPTPPSA